MPRLEHHWFESLADHMGEAYLRYAFTMGTDAEVDFLMDVLGLESGDRVLDVGCGPGRHSIELARRGIAVVGVDISRRFVEVATQAGLQASQKGELQATVDFSCSDARELTFSEEFDAAIAMCQGAFGLQAGPASGEDPLNLDSDTAILSGMARAVREGGRVGVSAFSSYFQVRHLEPDGLAGFDVMSGSNHEVTEIRDPQGSARVADLWTTCFTPRELGLIAERAGLTSGAIYSVYSGERYTPMVPNLDDPEFFLVSTKGSN